MSVMTAMNMHKSAASKAIYNMAACNKMAPVHPHHCIDGSIPSPVQCSPALHPPPHPAPDKDKLPAYSSYSIHTRGLTS
jgi:hypothetical protein